MYVQTSIQGGSIEVITTPEPLRCVISPPDYAPVYVKDPPGLRIRHYLAQIQEMSDKCLTRAW